MLPSATLKEIKRMNGWCYDGGKRANAYHKAVGKPKQINAYDVIRALRIRRGRNGVSCADTNRAICATIRLIDEETANCIMQKMKKKRCANIDGYYSFSLGRRIRHKRYYPKKITCGSQLRALLSTASVGDKIELLHETLKERV